MMAEPALVADCVSAMKASVRIPVTVKPYWHRRPGPRTSLVCLHYSHQVGKGGCVDRPCTQSLAQRLIATREPLDYALVRRLKAACPDLAIILNGDLASVEQAQEQIEGLDGIMMGRCVSKPLAASASRSRVLWLTCTVRFSQGCASCARALYRRRTRKGNTAQFNRASCAWTFPGRTGSACVSTTSRDGGDQVWSRSIGPCRRTRKTTRATRQADRCKRQRDKRRHQEGNLRD